MTASLFWRNKTHFSPTLKAAGDGEQGCASHLSQLLARKRNLHPALHLSTDMLQKSEKSERNTSGNSFRRNFAKPLFQFIQPGGKNQAGVFPDLRILQHVVLNFGVIPDQGGALINGASGTGVVARCGFRERAHNVARAVHPENNLIAIGRQLRNLHAASADQRYVAERLTLHE